MFIFNTQVDSISQILARQKVQIEEELILNILAKHYSIEDLKHAYNKNDLSKIASFIKHHRIQRMITELEPDTTYIVAGTETLGSYSIKFKF